MIYHFTLPAQQVKSELMNDESRFQGTLLYIAARSPAFLLYHGGGAVLALTLIGLGTSQRWWSLLPLGLLLLLLVTYFFVAALWSAYRLYDIPGQRPADLFFQLGPITPTTSFIHLGMGLRRTAKQLSRRLTAGRLTVLDIYNPQLASGSVLARARHATALGPSDPRLRWLEGTIQLLPLPDRSTNLVTVEGALGELWQHGDRELLLAEIYRILKPEGRLVLAEPVRSQVTWMLWGAAAAQLRPVTYWRRLLIQAGFNLLREETVEGILCYFVVERPAVGEMQQLTLDLGI